MKKASRLLTILLLVLSVAVLMACSTAPPANTNQPKANQQAANANTPPANTSASKKTESDSTTGSIEVTSVPAGARVLLISIDEDTAGEPQPKGSTPTTITGVRPGKYTVDLERSGYRFFQRSVKVSAGKTVKINATLRKQ